jgi:hypothetical protein
MSGSPVLARKKMLSKLHGAHVYCTKKQRRLNSKRKQYISCRPQIRGATIPYERIGIKNDYPPLHEGSQIDLHSYFPKRKVKQLRNINSEYIRTKVSVIPQPYPPYQILIKKYSCSLARNFIQLMQQSPVLEELLSSWQPFLHLKAFFSHGSTTVE